MVGNDSLGIRVSFSLVGISFLLFFLIWDLLPLLENNQCHEGTDPISKGPQRSDTAENKDTLVCEPSNGSTLRRVVAMYFFFFFFRVSSPDGLLGTYSKSLGHL